MESPTHALHLSLLPGRYSICQLAAGAELPAWIQDGEFISITRTSTELSLVCREESVPAGVRCEPGWRVLRLEGPFAFDQTGILLAVLAPLAQAGVSVFALSTFDTDYVLVKEDLLERARPALAAAGHRLAVA